MMDRRSNPSPVIGMNRSVPRASVVPSQFGAQFQQNFSPIPQSRVLLSGGLDSTACVYYYLSSGYEVTGIFIDYGQDAARMERAAARRVAAHFGIPLVSCQWRGTDAKHAGPIMGRNAFLLTAALLESPNFSGTIALGIHAGTLYADCTRSFARSLEAVFALYTHGVIQLGTPFGRWTKRLIWEYAIQNDIPVSLTYSCELGLSKPCGLCTSCRDMEILRAGS